MMNLFKMYTDWEKMIAIIGRMTSSKDTILRVMIMLSDWCFKYQFKVNTLYRILYYFSIKLEIVHNSNQGKWRLKIISKTKIILMLSKLFKAIVSMIHLVLLIQHRELILSRLSINNNKMVQMNKDSISYLFSNWYESKNHKQSSQLNTKYVKLWKSVSPNWIRKFNHKIFNSKYRVLLLKY